MKKAIVWIRLLAVLWLAVISAAMLLLLFPIFVILPESIKHSINDKLEVFTDFLTDRLDNLTEEL